MAKDWILYTPPCKCFQMIQTILFSYTVQWYFSSLIILSYISLIGVHPPATVAAMVTAGRTMVAACLGCVDSHLLPVTSLGQQASLVGRSGWGNVWNCWCHFYGEKKGTLLSFNFTSLIILLDILYTLPAFTVFGTVPCNNKAARMVRNKLFLIPSAHRLHCNSTQQVQSLQATFTIGHFLPNISLFINRSEHSNSILGNLVFQMLRSLLTFF